MEEENEMEKDNKYSITSNNIKMLKHLDNLKSLQKGKPVPVMVHMMPTNQCNLKCPTCCFSTVRNDGMQQDLEYMKNVMWQFRLLGTKAVEITGGGDPTCYPQINELVEFLHEIGYSIGINTNGHLAKNIKDWSKLTWVRLSMNTLDFYPSFRAYPIDHIRYPPEHRKGPDITGCYVWNKPYGKKTFDKLYKFAHKHKIAVRIVPDCITTKGEIERQMSEILELLTKKKNNKYLFLSDFNVDTGKRKNNKCYMHSLKPCFFTDGYIYSCPSSELSKENGITLQKKFRVCKGDEVGYYYVNQFKKWKPCIERSCYYCKYKQQNELIEDLLTETIHNEFA